MKKLIFFYCNGRLRGFDDTQFNFSSKYKVNYDKNTETLTINKGDKNYIDNFFGENIELSAIVGNNGVGKSTLLKRIFTICYSKIEYMSAKEIILGFELPKISHLLFLYFDIENTNNPFKYAGIRMDDTQDVKIVLGDFYEDEPYGNEPLTWPHCQYITEVMDHELYSNYYNNSKIGMMKSALSEYPNESTNIMAFFYYQLKQQSSFLGNCAEKIKLPFTYPENLKIFSSYVPYKVCMTLKNSEDGEDTYGPPIDEDLLNIIRNLRYVDRFKALYALPDKFEDDILELLLMLFLKSVSEKEKKEISNYTDSDEFKGISGIYEKINDIFHFTEGKDSVNIAPYREFLEFLYDSEKKIVINEEKKCLEVPFGSVEKFIKKYSFIAGEMQFLIFSWGLSSGETAMLNLYSKFYQIYQSIKYSEKRDVLLLIDEADAYFHPQWQKDYVKDVLDVAKQIFEGFDVQIILSTHSPIMLSDIPKQNVLYLKKEKDAGTKVVPREERQETFGANIFSLFKDTFFLEGSGIGSFAEDKLEELLRVIRSLRENQESNTSPEEILRRIQCIGDPFIRRKFENEFKKYTKSDTRAALENRRARLENELEQIKRELGEN